MNNIKKCTTLSKLWFKTSLLLIFYCLLFFDGIIAQGRISGIIKNTGKDFIVGATVEYLNHKIISFTDSAGKFEIERIVGDTLYITAIGFKPVAVKMVPETNRLDIVLLDYYAVLDNVTVSNKKREFTTRRLGFYSKKDHIQNHIAKGMEYAVFIPNLIQIEAYIDEIRFRLSDFNNSPYTLRIRLLGMDPDTNLPSDSLLYSENYIEAGSLRKINKIILKNKNVIVPLKGIFVTYQWILNSSAKLTQYIPTPGILENRIADKNHVFSKYRNRGWELHYLFKERFDGKYFAVPNLSLLVSY